MAIVIKSNGSESETENTPTFSDCQKIVGGLVEVVQINSEQTLLVNEEGIPMDLPFNKRASELCGMHIVGDVVFLSSAREANKILDG